MAKTEAQKRALKKYDEEHKSEFKSFYFKFSLKDADTAMVIEKLLSVDNKQDYIRQLILEDIKKHGI